MTDLYLVRHGETDWNRQRRIQGRTDIPLNDTGREQARLAASVLSSLPVARVYSSPLVRARETAEIISALLGTEPSSALADLTERDYGAAEGLTSAEVDARFPEGSSVPRQEDRSHATARFLAAVAGLAKLYPHDSLVVVSHGGVLRGAFEAVGHRVGRITNGSIHTLRATGGDFRVVAHADPAAVIVEGPESGRIQVQNVLEAG